MTYLEVRTDKVQEPGLHISRATLDGIMKYKSSYSQVDRTKLLEDWKFYYDDDFDVIEFACYDKPMHVPVNASGQFLPDHDIKLKSYECQIMEWADDIAYSTHDLEDGLKVGMITKSSFSENIKKHVKEKVELKGLVWSDNVWEKIRDDIENVSSEHGSEEKRKKKRKDLISSYIDTFIQTTTRDNRKGGPPYSRYEHTLVPEDSQKLKCNMLKSLVRELIINDERLATLQRKATSIVEGLFEEFTNFSDDRTKQMYPADFREKLDRTGNDNSKKMRVACDYISGMTDGYASRMYSRLREGETSSLFEVI